MDERTIFTTALAQRDPEARAAYLAEACGNDDALRAIRLFTNKIAEAVIEGRALATEHDFAAAATVADESPVDVTASEYNQYLDPQYAQQLMSESLREDDLVDLVPKRIANLDADN